MACKVQYWVSTPCVTANPREKYIFSPPAAPNHTTQKLGNLFFLFILDLYDPNVLWFDARVWHHMVWWKIVILSFSFSVAITVRCLNEVIAHYRLHSTDCCLCRRCITLWIVSNNIHVPSHYQMCSFPLDTYLSSLFAFLSHYIP